MDLEQEFGNDSDSETPSVTLANNVVRDSKKQHTAPPMFGTPLAPTQERESFQEITGSNQAGGSGSSHQQYQQQQQQQQQQQALNAQGLQLQHSKSMNEADSPGEQTVVTGPKTASFMKNEKEFRDLYSEICVFEIIHEQPELEENEDDIKSQSSGASMVQRKIIRAEITISECETRFEKSAVSKSEYTSYKIQVQEYVNNNQNRQLECSRRYKEFLALRGALKVQWPGCYIPPLPEKTVIGKMNQEVIDKRRKQLELFLQGIAKRSYLYASAEFQFFLQSPSEHVHKKLMKLVESKISNEQLIKVHAKFSKWFTKHSAQDVLQEESNAFQFKIFLINAKKKVMSLLKGLRGVADAFESYRQAYETLVSTFLPQIETGVIQGAQIVTAEDRQPHDRLVAKIRRIDESFFEKLYGFMEHECHEIDSMIEAIDYLDQYRILANQTFNQRLQVEQEYTQISKGKKTFKSIFSTKKTNDLKLETESKIQHLSQQEQMLKQLRQVFAQYLLAQEITTFKEEKSRAYKELLQQGAPYMSLISQEMILYWQEMSKLSQNTLKLSETHLQHFREQQDWANSRIEFRSEFGGGGGADTTQSAFGNGLPERAPVQSDYGDAQQETDKQQEQEEQKQE